MRNWIRSPTAAVWGPVDVESQRRLRNLRVDRGVGLQTVGTRRLESVANGAPAAARTLISINCVLLAGQVTESPLGPIAEHLGRRIAADELQIRRQHVLTVPRRA